MTRRVRRAVFPVAGLGTRMLPMTRAVPKEMLPVSDRPLVQYAVEEAVAAGISELIFVTDRSRPVLEAHFGPAVDLVGKTEAGPGGERLDAARALVPPEVELRFVPQGRPLGLGHAVWCARQAVGGEPFAVVLPDDLMVPGCLADLVETFHAGVAAGVVAVEEVPLHDTPRYGVVDVGGRAPDQVSPISSIVEKPAPEQAPSNLAVVGRYVFDASIMDLLGSTGPGAGGEIQLTDAIAALAASGAVLASRFRGKRYDCGNREGWLRATVALALAGASPDDAFPRDLESLPRGAGAPGPVREPGPADEALLGIRARPQRAPARAGLAGPVAKPRARVVVRRGDRRRGRARPRDRVLPRLRAPDHQRRGAREGLAGGRQHRPQHHHRPIELPLGTKPPRSTRNPSGSSKA